MELPPLTRNYFSSNPEKEQAYRRLCWFLTFSTILVLYFFWEPLRSTSFTYALVSVTVANNAVGIFFRFVTALGSEAFFIPFFSVIYWSVNKSLGFWGLIIMPLSVFISSEIPKDIIRLPRPDVRGVSVPTYTFPSGHSSGAVSVWGYLAIRVRRRWFSIWALVIILLVGLSRTMLGYHFPGDVLGGFVTGTAFIALFFWLANVVMENRWGEGIPYPLLLFAVLVVPLAMSFIPATFAPRLMGYVAGAGTGYLLARENLRYYTKASWPKQLARAVLGLAVLSLITLGLNAVLPVQAHLLTFTQCALATFWVTYAAPRTFIKLGLS